MYPLSDKDLDRMSREAAEQNDVDLSPAGWERLEHKLNKELPTKKDKDRRRFLWIFFFAIALSGSGLVYLLTGKESTVVSKSVPNSKSTNPAVNKDNIANEKNSTVKDENESISPVDKDSHNNSKRKENGEETADQPIPVAPLASVAEDKDKSTENLTKKIVPKTQASSVDSKRIGLVSPGQRKQTTTDVVKTSRKRKNNGYVTQPEMVLETRTIPKRTSNEVNTKEVNTTAAEEKEVESKTNTDTDLSKPVTNPTDTTNKTGTQTVDEKQIENTQPTTEKDGVDTAAKQNPITQEIAKSKKSAPKSPITNRFAFGILAGTDISNINGELKTKAGYSFGILASYNITKRFSVNTGFSVTKKFYKAAGSDFHPPKHYFTYYVDKLVSVDGSCFMWELPLNLRYDLVATSKLKWYLNAGMSSYIMRKQDYRYDYIYNGTPASRDWSSSSQQNEWFKIVNLSSGIEYSLNKRWSMQAEPYFKLPTSGIGFGKMDISSYGLMFGLRYRPNFKK